MPLLFFFLFLFPSLAALPPSTHTLNLNFPLSSCSISQEVDFASVNSSITNLDKDIFRTMVPSLIKFEGDIDGNPLLHYDFVYSIRADIKISNSIKNGSYIGIAFLDKNYELVGKPRFLTIPKEINPEDARAFLFQGSLFYSYNFATPTGREMALYDFSSHEIINLSLEDLKPASVEKNWSFFELENQLVFVYCYDPFILFTTDIDTGLCQILHCDEKELPSVDNKILRGGSSPLKLKENLFFSFIHSRAAISSLVSPLLFTNAFIPANYLWLYRPHLCLFSTNPFKVLYVSEQFSFLILELSIQFLPSLITKISL